MNTAEWIEAENKHCAQNYYPLPVVLSRGEGVWLWDVEGKKYLDMMSAYSAVSFGHCHPSLVKALTEQANQLCVVSRAFHTNTLGPFLEKLCELSGFEMALPMNTGVEAVETAIKAARRWGYAKKGIPENSAKIVVAKNNFHGRTISIISFSSEESYRAQFGPFTPGFIEIPFGDSEALKKIITPDVCAFLIEPIQGEAGIQIPPQGWLKACENICRENKVLLIADEIQTGLGRTGKLFAFEHDGVRPDALILGKALGGGILPVSAFLANKTVMELFTPGSHGSTFGGNALAARIGTVALELLQKENLIKNSEERGEQLLSGLRSIRSPLFKEVRGKGLFVGLEIDPKIASGRNICLKLMENGILSKDVHESVIRFAPPLIIDKETIEWSIMQISKAIADF